MKASMRALLALLVLGLLAFAAVNSAAADDIDDEFEEDDELDTMAADGVDGGAADAAASGDGDAEGAAAGGAEGGAEEEELEEDLPEDHDVEYFPELEGAFFLETFQDEDIFNSGRVIKSSADQYVYQMLEVAPPSLFSGIAGDKGLIATMPAKHYGVGMPFSEPLVMNDGDAFVLQYEVRLQEGLECGGAYLKVVSNDPVPNLGELDNETPYIVMFGPDKCGATNKVHFIVRYKNPVTNEWAEHHVADPPHVKADKYNHLYTLIIRPDNSFEIKIDGVSEKTGSLLEDLTPPINPPKEIDDPEDEKPDDWVDEEEIDDPEATKPEDWDDDAPATIPDMDAAKPEGWLDDEPEHVPDPEAEMPDDWDEEEDGDWEPPLVPNPRCEEAPGCGEWIRPRKANPDYQGVWKPPRIANPDYVGEWKPRKIPNAAYFVDDTPYKLAPMAGVGIEIWTMTGGMLFDNILVTQSEEDAADFATKTWAVKHSAQLARDERERVRVARRARERAYQTGGILDKLNYFVLEGADMASANPIPAALVLVLLIASTYFVCCRGDSSSGRSGPRPTYRAVPSGDASDDDLAATPAAGGDDDDDNSDDNDGAGDNDDDNDDDDEEETAPAAAAGDAAVDAVSSNDAIDASKDDDEAAAEAPSSTGSRKVRRRNRKGRRADKVN